MATSFIEIEENVDRFLELIPDNKRSILVDLAKLTEECGEVAEAIIKPRKTKEDIAEELCDVVFVCFVIARRLKLHLGDVYFEKRKRGLDKLRKQLNKGDTLLYHTEIEE